MTYSVTKPDKQYRGHVVKQKDWELTDPMSEAEADQYIEKMSPLFSNLDKEAVWY